MPKQNSEIGRRRLFGIGLAAATSLSIGIEAKASTDGSEQSDVFRRLGPPTSISPAAQQYLRSSVLQPPPLPPPPLPPPPVDDTNAWRRYIEKGNAAMPLDLIEKIPGFLVDKRMTGDTTFYAAIPSKQSETPGQKVHFYIHGGGWILFGGAYTAALAKIAAMQYGCITYAVDYRMPPDHAFPIGLEDCLGAYLEVIAKHGAKNVFVSGQSAGGNLAAALMLKLKDKGLPRPCALYLDSPVTDLTNSGDSWTVLDGFDPVLRDKGGVGSVTLYLNGRDPRDPYLSPLYGDLSTFPPTHLHTGTRDRLLSDTVRFHAALRAAGVPADLFVSEAMPHAGFGAVTKEDALVISDTRRWLGNYWGRL